MTIFDQLFYFIFTTYKARFKQKANTIALVYISLFQITLLFLAGCFLAAFFSQLHFKTIPSNKACTIFVLAAIGIHFKNWITYNGKTRKVMNAKLNRKKAPTYNLIALIVLPFLSVIMGLLFLQAL